jgi:hypothetical protein
MTRSPSREAHLITQSPSCEEYLVTQILPAKDTRRLRGPECEEESPALHFDGKRASFMPFRVRFATATTCVHFAGPREFDFIFAPGDPNFAGC